MNGRLKQVARRIGGNNPLFDRLPVVDKTSQQARLVYWKDVLGELNEIAEGPLTPQDREDYEVFRQQVEVQYQAQVFEDYQRPFTCFSSFWAIQRRCCASMCCVRKRIFATQSV